MGTFHVGARIEHVVDRSRGAALPKLLVDTGSGYTWAPGATLEKLGVAREKKDLEFVMAGVINSVPGQRSKVRKPVGGLAWHGRLARGVGNMGGTPMPLQAQN